MSDTFDRDQGIAQLRQLLLTPGRESCLKIQALLKRWPKDGAEMVAYDHARRGLKRWAREEVGGMRFPLREQLGEGDYFSDAMIYCPPGEFWMGTDDGGPWGEDGEQPRHQVRITQGFWMGQTPVTQALYRAVMDENPSRFEGEERPVESVSWFDAVRFCNRLSEIEGLAPAYQIGSGDEPTVDWRREAEGYRLPTEAEWEYAAKAGTELIYSGSNEIDEVAWYDGNAGGETRPVGQKTANAWGLHDMSGNVWEWCTDEWDRSAYQDRTGTVEDPARYTGGGGARVWRGGCWCSGPEACRVAFRFWAGPGLRYDTLGFRLRVSVAKRR